MVARCANSHRIQLATASFPLLHLQPLTVCENRRWGGGGVLGDLIVWMTLCLQRGKIFSCNICARVTLEVRTCTEWMFTAHDEKICVLQSLPPPPVYFGIHWCHSCDEISQGCPPSFSCEILYCKTGQYNGLGDKARIEACAHRSSNAKKHTKIDH